ncbi:hypothetical protein A3Q56_00709 [Intoshia linei]|uniref:Cell division cycle protein 27 homolog n=1 Tax=Intoshia linei TaxID=1819745 RepID=A0A177BB38_9BILA|nr:hypothetical protein A3Q56_00709 [Intoshia linei]
MIDYERIKVAIKDCLTYNNLDDAIFLSERLHAQIKNPETIYLLAKSLYRSRSTLRTYNFLCKFRNNQLCTKSRIMCIQVCFDLKKYREAQFFAFNTMECDSISLDDLYAIYGKEVSFVARLLGKIYAFVNHFFKILRGPKIFGDLKSSIMYHAFSLSMNQYNFSSFDNLLQHGIEPGLEIFDDQTILNEDLLIYSKYMVTKILSQFDANSLISIDESLPVVNIIKRNQNKNPLSISQSDNVEIEKDLIYSFNTAMSEKNQNAYTKSPQDYVKSVKTIPKKLKKNEFEFLPNSTMSFLSIMKCIADAFYEFYRYDTEKFIKKIQRLNPNQFNTPWIQGIIGTCYYHSSEYDKSVEAFKYTRELEESYVLFMDYYSQTLWHVKDLAKLSLLSSYYLANYRRASETWCIMGNFISVSKSGTESFKYFKRAIEINPEYFLSYAILGCEYLNNNKDEIAITNFYDSIRCNPRHFISWYGLSHLFYRNGNISRSKFYLDIALSINPNNIVLQCQYGLLLSDMGHLYESLDHMDLYISKYPKHPLCRFHKAMILFNKSKFKESMVELLILQDMIPEEAMIYFMMGRIYKRQGKHHLARLNFSRALEEHCSNDDNLKRNVNPFFKSVATFSSNMEVELLDTTDTNFSEDIITSFTEIESELSSIFETSVDDDDIL